MLVWLSVNGRSRAARRGGMVTKARQVILVIVLIFIAYAIYTSPARSADAVHAIWNVIVNAMNAIFKFFDNLIKG
jgi:ABC-type uncharacterized transport system permease subunit